MQCPRKLEQRKGSIDTTSPNFRARDRSQTYVYQTIALVANEDVCVEDAVTF
jgi:hypothetical protein